MAILGSEVENKMIAHSVRELIKVTEVIDSAIFRTKSLGLWYIPLGNEGPEKEKMAKELGGDTWGSPSTSWCMKHNNEIFRSFPVAGCYKAEVA